MLVYDLTARMRRYISMGAIIIAHLSIGTNYTRIFHTRVVSARRPLRRTPFAVGKISVKTRSSHTPQQTPQQTYRPFSAFSAEFGVSFRNWITTNFKCGIFYCTRTTPCGIARPKHIHRRTSIAVLSQINEAKSAVDVFNNKFHDARRAWLLCARRWQRFAFNEWIGWLVGDEKYTQTHTHTHKHILPQRGARVY